MFWSLMLMFTLNNNAYAGNLVIPQDSPNNYQGWKRTCSEDQITTINAKIKNLSLRIKNLADNSADLARDAGLNAKTASDLEAAADLLDTASGRLGKVCPPAALGTKIGSAMYSLGSAYADLASQSNNAQIEKNRREAVKLLGYLRGWEELREHCCKKSGRSGDDSTSEERDRNRNNRNQDRGRRGR
ncbi:MAG: hypothetical protein AAFV53_36015 [Myxococcota bacterium]